MQRIVHIEGRGVPVRGNDIDTDRIIPARFLRAITFDGMEQHVFEDDRKSGGHPFDDPRFQGATVLLVDSNFGCGSSREHAPQALRRWGIEVVVGESFAEIFSGNSLMIGLACVTASRDTLRTLMNLVERNPETVLRVDLAEQTLEADGQRYPIALPPNVRDALMTGAWDTTGMLLDRYSQVETVASQLPYMSNFR
jgi:3-isopropylmalate/(R)-2-methylmalate dehydratase small subunit